MKNIQIFSRHCNFSSSSVDKNRPNGFNTEICYHNLKRTLNKDLVDITFIMDGNKNEHFLKDETEYEIIEINGGSDAKSQVELLNIIKDKDFNDETIIYLLEDDHFHRDGWSEILNEVFTSVDVDYVSLYDHADKYFLSMYDDLSSKILHTKSCHWRTVPSTTNTYSCKYKTLKKHFDIHLNACTNAVKAGSPEKAGAWDHEKFIKLWNEGSNLITSIPGWSTHMESEYLSPTIDWEQLIKREIEIVNK